MVDCADKERIDEARRELHKIINDREMKEAIILIFANKQDLKGGGWRVNMARCPLLNLFPPIFCLLGVTGSPDARRHT